MFKGEERRLQIDVLQPGRDYRSPQIPAAKRPPSLRFLAYPGQRT